MPRPPLLLLALLTTTAPLGAQPPGFGPGRGPGGGPRFESLELVARFDADGDGRLSVEERQAARAFARENAGGRRRGPMGPPRGEDGGGTPAKPGERLNPEDVPHYGKKHDLYDLGVVRTLFLTFEADDWAEEMADFHRTDVEVPATLVVDGRKIGKVGVSYRGNTSFFTVAADRKRSLNVSIDYAKDGRRLYGVKTLNLLNSHTDPSFLREVTFLHLVRQFFPAPRANFARVVINGEDWGVYVNVEQYNKDFLERAYGTRDGVRWKVPPEFGGSGGLTWLGPDRAAYERVYQLKTSLSPEEEERAWAALIELCRVVNLTTPEERAQRLPRLFDVRGALQTIAIERVVGDGDGYISRASDYVLVQDRDGVFHMLPHDSNETFADEGGGPGRGRGGPGGRGGRRGRPGGDDPDAPEAPPAIPDELPSPPEQGIFALANEPARPLFRKLIQVPAWRAEYVAAVREVLERTRWEAIGPFLERAHATIADLVRKDTRKLYTLEAFLGSVDGPAPAPPQVEPEDEGGEERGEPPFPGGRRGRRGGFGFGGARTPFQAFLAERHRVLAEDPALRAGGR